MISKNQKTQIVKILGHRYVTPIQDLLKELKETNRKGNPYSSSNITNVMNGTPHKVIEVAIWTAVKKQKAINKHNEEILKTA